MRDAIFFLFMALASLVMMFLSFSAGLDNYGLAFMLSTQVNTVAVIVLIEIGKIKKG